jgi:serine/threonine protein kinase
MTFLPSTGDPLRSLTLTELIKADLEIRWRRGQNGLLENYLEQFPELGTVHTLPAALIYEEYRARQRYGDKPALDSYQARFPEQYPEICRLVQERPVPPVLTPAPPVAGPAGISRQEMAIVNDEVLRVSGGYRLVERINRGAFGDVWRAEAPGGVEVAIKIIFGSVAETQGQRELQALELIKRLRHPFLLPIHAYWQLEDRLLIAMELADGSLRDRARERQRHGLGGLPVEELLPYFRETAEALDFLHDKRVLHRDIKPENILILAGHAKVADFDLARVVEQTRRLNTSSHCGTPAYTAPEVFWRGKVGAPSDQYSLAVTYAEMRLNRPLFPSSSWFQLMHDHLQRTPDLVPLLEAEQRVLRRALAKDPADRFGSCREFMQALERTVPR